MVGFIAGLAVFFTSIGSGLIAMAFLIHVFKSPQKLVGTSVTFSFALTILASTLHFALGNVNLPLVALLLLGGVPGVYLGYRINHMVPRKILLTALALLIFLLGISFLLAFLRIV